MGLSIEKLIVIGIIALFLVGPEKLPDYAQRLGRFVRQARRMLEDAKDRVKEELGPEFDEDEWRKLDPRQYDPRRIIRDALLEPVEPRKAAEPERAAERTPERTPERGAAARDEQVSVWDDEAT